MYGLDLDPVFNWTSHYMIKAVFMKATSEKVWNHNSCTKFLFWNLK